MQLGKTDGELEQHDTDVGVGEEEKGVW